jgi:multiple antibiotic resistance protein
MSRPRQIWSEGRRGLAYWLKVIPCFIDIDQLSCSRMIVARLQVDPVSRWFYYSIGARAVVDFAMSAFVTLLLVVDPVGLVPAFLSVTHGMTEQDRTAIAIRSPLIAAVILVTLALCGNWLLRQLGVGIAAFQIAGGLLLFGVSYRMIFGDRPYREAREADRALSEHVSDIAVFPLAIPLMAGPGAITTTLLLSGPAAAPPRLIIVIVTILLVCLVCMLCFRLSPLIVRTLGRTGNAVFSRLLGILLAAYSVQFVLDGIAAVRETNC